MLELEIEQVVLNCLEFLTVLNQGGCSSLGFF
jgi:hypothetical protein